MTPQTFPALKLDEHGRCPNCLIKPLTYRRDRKFYCCRCDREYDMATGEQQPSSAWLAAGEGQFIPKYGPDDPPACSDYVRAKPSEATRRAAAKTEARARTALGQGGEE